MLYDSDSLLVPYKRVIQDRYHSYLQKAELLRGGKNFLSENCNSYLYYGLHFTGQEWILREWAPNATALYLLFEANHWQKEARYAFQRVNQEN